MFSPSPLGFKTSKSGCKHISHPVYMIIGCEHYFSIANLPGSTLGLRTTLWATVTLQTVRLTPSLIPAARGAYNVANWLNFFISYSFIKDKDACNQNRSLLHKHY